MIIDDNVNKYKFVHFENNPQLSRTNIKLTTYLFMF